jgi:glutaredoxin
MTYTVIGMPTCPWCIKAIMLLFTRGLTCKVFSVQPGSPQLTAAKRRWKHTTVPIVLRAGKLVGGYTDLQRLLK